MPTQIGASPAGQNVDPALGRRPSFGTSTGTTSKPALTFLKLNR